MIPEEKESQDALWDLLGEQPRMGAAPAQTNPLPSKNPAGSWGAVPPANPAGSPGAGPSDPYPYQPNQEEGMEGKSPIFSRIYSRFFFQKKKNRGNALYFPSEAKIWTLINLKEAAVNHMYVRIGPLPLLDGAQGENSFHVTKFGNEYPVYV